MHTEASSPTPQHPAHRMCSTTNNSGCCMWHAGGLARSLLHGMHIALRLYSASCAEHALHRLKIWISANCGHQAKWTRRGVRFAWYGGSCQRAWNAVTNKACSCSPAQTGLVRGTAFASAKLPTILPQLGPHDALNLDNTGKASPIVTKKPAECVAQFEIQSPKKHAAWTQFASIAAMSLQTSQALSRNAVHAPRECLKVPCCMQCKIWHYRWAGAHESHPLYSTPVAYSVAYSAPDTLFSAAQSTYVAMPSVLFAPHAASGGCAGLRGMEFIGSSHACPGTRGAREDRRCLSCGFKVRMSEALMNKRDGRGDACDTMKCDKARDVDNTLPVTTLSKSRDAHRAACQ
eukprot:1149364-Pelagomonas_calceolata.AAC.3